MKILQQDSLNWPAMSGEEYNKLVKLQIAEREKALTACIKIIRKLDDGNQCRLAYDLISNLLYGSAFFQLTDADLRYLTGKIGELSHIATQVARERKNHEIDNQRTQADRNQRL